MRFDFENHNIASWRSSWAQGALSGFSWHKLFKFYWAKPASRGLRHVAEVNYSKIDCFYLPNCKVRLVIWMPSDWEGCWSFLAPPLRGATSLQSLFTVWFCADWVEYSKAVAYSLWSLLDNHANAQPPQYLAFCIGVAGSNGQEPWRV